MPYKEVLWEINFLELSVYLQIQNFAFTSCKICTVFLDCQRKMAWQESKTILFWEKVKNKHWYDDWQDTQLLIIA